MSVLSQITAVPAAFVNVFAKVNDAIRILSAINALEVGQGLNLVKGDTKWLLTLDANTNDGSGAEGAQDGTASTGSGLPSGYAEETFTICEDGAPVDVHLLVRRD